MGDRVSIQFVNGKEKSPVLFSHWAGMRLVEIAKHYVIELNRWIKKEGRNMCEPLERKEPGIVMIDFIHQKLIKNLGDKERLTSDYYLAISENDGDNSDNGHHEINLEENEE